MPVCKCLKLTETSNKRRLMSRIFFKIVRNFKEGALNTGPTFHVQTRRQTAMKHGDPIVLSSSFPTTQPSSCSCPTVCLVVPSLPSVPSVCCHPIKLHGCTGFHCSTKNNPHGCLAVRWRATVQKPAGMPGFQRRTITPPSRRTF